MIRKEVGCVLLLSSALMAQSSTGVGQSPAAAPLQEKPAIQQPTGEANDPLAEMRNDLNRLESLNLNMSSETEFLRDQNLQILLRTNSQMWTVLIHELRRQIEREEQRKAMESQPKDHRDSKPAGK